MSEKEKTIRVLVKKPYEPVEEQIIENDLKPKQEIVGGYIQCLDSGIEDIDIIINEEGKLLGLEPNIIWSFGRDILVGNVIFSRLNWENGEFVSLTDKDIEDIKKMYGF